tara:strand:- start:2256 stop:2933 length:678 start_codon:yes stop_codon:yes gene_type:complete
MSSEKKPKKRGRKPKNIIKTEIKKENTNEKTINNHLIIQLKKEDYNNSKEVESFDTINKYYETNNNVTISEVCWNCCHGFNELIYGIPLKYDNNIFYIYGYFCSLECCGRYAHEYFKSDFSDIYTLINLYSNIVYQKKEKIKLSPNRLLLKMFGGHLSIEEFRNEKKNTYDITIPPILPLKHIINEQEINYTTNKQVLKLYRKKPIISEKNSIKNSMNLIMKESE